MWREQQLLLRSSTESADGSPSGKSKILFHNGELNLLWLVSDSVAAHCRTGDGAWEARTGSWLMRMLSDIFAAV